MARLQRLSLALARATTVEEVVEVIISEGMAACEANAGAIYRYDPETQEIYAVRIFGIPAEDVGAYARHTITIATPMTEAIRSACPLYIETRDERERRFPSTGRVWSSTPNGAVAVVPFQADGPILGAFGLNFPTDRTFSEDDRACLETVTHLCALSIARAIQFDETQKTLASLKQAESQRDWTRVILESSQAAIVVRDREGKFTLWNRGAEALYGYTAAEALGQTLSLIASPETVLDVLEREKRLQSGESTTFLEAERIDKWGRPLTVAVLLTALFDANGEYQGLSSVSYDITEKKRTENELHEALLRLRSLVENAPFAVIEWDANYCVRSWSPEAERMFGWTATEMIGKFIYDIDFVHPEDRPLVDDIMRAMNEGTRPSNVQRNRNLTRDGRVIYCEWHNSSLLNEAGQLKAVLSFVLDRTAREASEEAQSCLLQEVAAQQKRMDDILSTVPGVVWEAWGKPDVASQRINFVSDYVQTMLGYTVEEWVNTPNFWLTIVHTDDKERAAATAARSWSTGRQHLNTFRWMTKDGRSLWCESHSVVIKDENGQPLGMRGVTMDVSLRHAAEAALRESEGRFRELADTVPQMVFSQTPSGVMEYVNQQWREYTGLTLEQANSGERMGIIHPDDRDAFASTWQECFESGAPCQQEFRCRRASDGVYRWFLCRIVPIRDSSGNITRWLGTSTDIDALKSASAEIEDLNRRLRQAMTETHHRVKNNLQVIAALVDLQTLDGRDTVPRAEFERLSQHIRALAAVHDLLTQAAKEDSEAAYLNAKTVLERLLGVLKDLLLSGERSLHLSVSDARLTSRQATSFALITNELVSNAIKHGEGKVTVRFVVEGTTARLTVHDNGPGFPEDFNAARSAHTGLELVQNLASWDLRGQIVFGNAPDGGGQATILFPVEA